MRELYEAALDSYKVYLVYSGAWVSQDSRLVVLKWPDIAGAAIECMSWPHDSKEAIAARDLLVSDLKIMIYEPVKVTLDGLVQRVIDLTDKSPIGVGDKVGLAARLKSTDILVAKTVLLDCVDELAKTLNVMGIQCPSLKQIRGRNAQSL